MRTNILIMLSVLALGFAACTDDSYPSPNPSLPISTMTAKIDGASWTAQDVQMQQVNGGLDIYGAKTPTAGKTTSFLMNIKNYSGLSTYPIDSTNTAEYKEFGVTFTADSGSITVVTDNTVHIAGTFYFTVLNGGNMKTISDGSFNLYK